MFRIKITNHYPGTQDKDQDKESLSRNAGFRIKITNLYSGSPDQNVPIIMYDKERFYICMHTVQIMYVLHV